MNLLGSACKLAPVCAFTLLHCSLTESPVSRCGSFSTHFSTISVSNNVLRHD